MKFVPQEWNPMFKDLKPMKMGVIEPKRGKGKLKLQAVEIPKSQAMEFQLVQINRVKYKETA